MEESEFEQMKFETEQMKVELEQELNARLKRAELQAAAAGSQVGVPVGVPVGRQSAELKEFLRLNSFPEHTHVWTIVEIANNPVGVTCQICESTKEVVEPPERKLPLINLDKSNTPPGQTRFRIQLDGEERTFYVLGVERESGSVRVHFGYPPF